MCFSFESTQCWCRILYAHVHTGRDRERKSEWCRVKIMANEMKIKWLSSRALHQHFIFIWTVFERVVLWLSLFLCPCFNFLSPVSHILILNVGKYFCVLMRVSNTVYLCNMLSPQCIWNWREGEWETNKKEKKKKTTWNFLIKAFARCSPTKFHISNVYKPFSWFLLYWYQPMAVCVRAYILPTLMLFDFYPKSQQNGWWMNKKYFAFY